MAVQLSLDIVDQDTLTELENAMDYLTNRPDGVSKNDHLKNQIDMFLSSKLTMYREQSAIDTARASVTAADTVISEE